MQSVADGPSALLVVLDLLGIFGFALSGALVAVRKDLDLFGVLVLAGASGLGGGFVRDVLIGAVPPAALADLRYLLVPVAAGPVTGIGGGIARDLLAGRVPIVFRAELYATPALVGAVIAVTGVSLDVDARVVAIPAAAVCFVWRVLAMRRGWQAPRVSDV